MTGRAAGPGAARGRPRRRRVPVPVRPLVPLAGCAAVLLVWELVAHNSGAGWVQAVGDVLAGVLAVGLVAPALATGRARVRVVESPADASAGLPVELAVHASSRVRLTPLVPPGPATFAGPGRAGTVARPLTLLPERRGVHATVVVEVASAAPFGLLWWRRHAQVELPRALCVGPRLGAPLAVAAGAERAAGTGGRATPAPLGEPRGVRPYRPGDQRRFMHWPATAHTGDLMVREMEDAGAGPVTLEVHLPEDPEAAERLAERALGTVVALVDTGTPVRLATTEEDGARVGAVGDRRSAGRRLARAVADAAGHGAGTVTVAPAGPRPTRRRAP